MIESFQKDLLKDISTWFEILEEISKNTTDTSGLPKLEVSLRSGRMFSGSVIGLQKSTNENLLMLLEHADQQSNARVHLIQCEEVSAVSFVDPMVYLSIFSPKIISELDFKRKIKTVEENIEKITSSIIPITVDYTTILDTERNSVLNLMESLPSIFEKLAKDTIGKFSISEHVTHIEIRVSTIVETKLVDKTLVCSFAKESKDFLSKQKASLYDSIEKVL